MAEDSPLESRAGSAPGWMISFADLLSLLLSFFVLMFATTTIEQKDWHAVVAPIAHYLTGRADAPSGGGDTPVTRPARLDLAYVTALFRQQIGQNPALKQASLLVRPHAVILALPRGLDAARLSGGAPAALRDVARFLGNLDNRVVVVTHVRPAPAEGPNDAWTRALDQSLLIAAELKRLGYGKLPGIEGMVDHPDDQTGIGIDLVVQDTAMAGGLHVAP